MIKLLCYNKEYTTGALPVVQLLLQSVKKFDINFPNDLSKRRVETGFETTDHSYIRPNTISISGIIGDVNKRDNMFLGTSIGVFTVPFLGWTFSRNYIEELKTNMNKIRDDKMFVVIYNTKDGRFYDNYLLSNLTISDLSSSRHGFEFSMTFQQVIISNIGEIEASVSNKKAPAKNGAKGQGSADGKRTSGIRSIAKEHESDVIGLVKRGKDALSGLFGGGK